MLKIEFEGPNRNRITLTQGDSAVLKLKLRDVRNKLISLGDNDVAVLSIKEQIDSPKAVLTLTADKEQQFDFKPQDTLALACGKYIYDVRFTMANGSSYAVISPAQFIIAKGVA